MPGESAKSIKELGLSPTAEALVRLVKSLDATTKRLANVLSTEHGVCVLLSADKRRIAGFATSGNPFKVYIATK